MICFLLRHVFDFDSSCLLQKLTTLKCGGLH
jgi:hypothetical protein